MKAVKLVYTLIHTHSQIKGRERGRKYLSFIMIKSYLILWFFRIEWKGMGYNVYIYTRVRTHTWYENVFAYIAHLQKLSMTLTKL